MSIIDNNAKKQKSVAPSTGGRGEGETMPDDDAGCDTWGFARGTYDLSRELHLLTEDALRRVGRLSPQSRELLKLLLDGCGNDDMVATTGLTHAQVEQAREQMLAELDATSTTDAIRIGICAAYHPPRDS